MNTDHQPTATSYVAQGQSLHQDADLHGALECYTRALQADPSNVAAHFLSALIAVKHLAFETAEKHLRAACERQPNHAPTALLRGHVLNQLGQPEKALICLDVAERLIPGSPLLWTYRAQALWSLDRHDEALMACDRALASDPGQVSALLTRAACFHMLHRHNEAVAACNAFLDAAPEPAQGHVDVTRILLSGLGRDPQEAETLRRCLQHLNTAIARAPHWAQAHEGRGAVLERTGDIPDALASYRKALQLRPDWDDAAYGEGRCLLSLGQWQQGWLAHERRWFRPRIQAWRRDTGAPLWKGESLAGKSIAVVAERGFGDVIQFFRFVEPLRALAGSVSLVLPPALQRLLDPGNVQGTAPAGPFDYHCPILSLAHRLGITPSTVPGRQGYLSANAALAAAWRQQLGPATRLRVGLVWSGDPFHGNDHNRSLQLARLSGLLALEGIDFVCLQQVMRDTDRQAHARLSNLRFYGPQLHDFADTAALCDAMDVVICADTSVAHLAGALGKPLWLLLPAVAEWRWMLEREDSPWYAHARLFRQPRRGDWDSVIARVRNELLALRARRAATDTGLEVVGAPCP